jgi:hypothetical protein
VRGISQKSPVELLHTFAPLFYAMSPFHVICSIIRCLSVARNSGVRLATTSIISALVSEYMCQVPFFLLLTKPAFLSIFRWRETTGWISFKWGVISQTHFSPSCKNSIISSLIGSESALKILALKRVRLADFEDIIRSNLYKYLNIVIDASSGE